jgi:hypothetical protein
MNQYILVHTSIYSNFRHSNALISRYSIHHCTGQYNEVPESPVPLDFDGTRRYIKVQGFVLSSTLMYRRNPGVQDFWVLHCTAQYSDVSSNGISRHECVGNQVCTSMYWFILVHTSTYCYILTRECVYWYIPVYTVTYKYKLVHTSTYQYIPVCTHTYWFILVHTGTYEYIRVHTNSYLC